MSTRCMVEVRGGINQTSEVLYHHSDGYPSNMVPLIQAAYRKFRKGDPATHSRSTASGRSGGRSTLPP